MAKELGITKETTNNRVKKEQNSTKDTSDSEPEEMPKRKNRKRILEDDDEFVPDKFSALVGTKRRKKEEKPEPVVVKPKLRRVEKKFVPVLEKLSIDEMMEINTYQRFNKTVEHVMKTAEEIDYSEISKEFYYLKQVSL